LKAQDISSDLHKAVRSTHDSIQKEDLLVTLCQTNEKEKRMVVTKLEAVTKDKSMLKNLNSTLDEKDENEICSQKKERITDVI